MCGYFSLVWTHFEIWSKSFKLLTIWCLSLGVMARQIVGGKVEGVYSVPSCHHLGKQKNEEADIVISGLSTVCVYECGGKKKSLKRSKAKSSDPFTTSKPG